MTRNGASPGSTTEWGHHASTGSPVRADAPVRIVCAWHCGRLSDKAPAPSDVLEAPRLVVGSSRCQAATSTAATPPPCS